VVTETKKRFGKYLFIHPNVDPVLIDKTEINFENYKLTLISCVTGGTGHSVAYVLEYGKWNLYNDGTKTEKSPVGESVLGLLFKVEDVAYSPDLKVDVKVEENGAHDDKPLSLVNTFEDEIKEPNIDSIRDLSSQESERQEERSENLISSSSPATFPAERSTEQPNDDSNLSSLQRNPLRKSKREKCQDEELQKEETAKNESENKERGNIRKNLEQKENKSTPETIVTAKKPESENNASWALVSSFILLVFEVLLIFGFHSSI